MVFGMPMILATIDGSTVGARHRTRTVETRTTAAGTSRTRHQAPSNVQTTPGHSRPRSTTVSQQTETKTPMILA